MATSSRSLPIFRAPWLLGAMVLFLMQACATSPAPERETSDRDRVDIGYGSVRAGDATGSVATVYTEDEKVIDATTLAEMLARIPGVQVAQLSGGQVSVRIRGTNSIQGGQEPLYVIDGMVVASGGGLLGISASNIKSVTVLKDAGSTAIYGSRGANGVILVQTKKGGE